MPVAAGIGPFGVPELLIIAFIIILIFGVGRLPEVGGALGKGIREFRKSSKEDGDDVQARIDGAAGTSAASTNAPSAGADSRFCSECGERNSASAKFCSKCGHTMGVMAS